MDKVFVDTQRIRTHCWTAGPRDGEPLLLIHGSLTSGRFFQSLASELGQDRFRIVAPCVERPAEVASLLREHIDTAQ